MESIHNISSLSLGQRNDARQGQRLYAVRRRPHQEKVMGGEEAIGEGVQKVNCRRRRAEETISQALANADHIG